MIRCYRLLCSMLVLSSTLACAMDLSDEGTYAVVHLDGHVTTKLLRFYRSGDSWRLVEQKADGTWNDDDACQGCSLAPSSPEMVNSFMGGVPPAGMSAECVNNAVLAICRVMEGGGENATRQYGFVGLGGERPRYLKLQRVSEEHGDRAAKPE